jgi:hypothetical protein
MILGSPVSFENANQTNLDYDIKDFESIHQNMQKSNKRGFSSSVHSSHLNQNVKKYTYQGAATDFANNLNVNH